MKGPSSKCPNLEDLIAIHLISKQIFTYLDLESELLPLRFVSQQFYLQILDYYARMKSVAKLKITQKYSNSLNNLCSLSKTTEILAFSKVVYPKSFKIINLSRCHWLEDSHLVRLTFSCAHLEELYLDHCWNISNQTLNCVIKKCGPELRKLSLANIYSIENQILVKISQCCPKLVWLSLRECWRVTDYGIRQLTSTKQCCPLTYLDLTKCSQVSPDCIALLLLDRGRQLEIVHDKAEFLR